ncbi:double-stranded RNA-binding protein 1-like [Euphorbia lathyris]|uniref:double-stranded RNA-binding protein 1-like n=1 Tax=Euphorbia lathyris TaxID=212925 RepID=UPI0033143421
MYKQKLHELCQKKKWELPKYSTVREGFGHTPTFKSSVSVNGISFDSLSPSTSSKKSQNCAAEIAILHFSSSVPDQESDSSNYIQELHDQPDIQSNEVVTDEHASEFPLSIATDDFEEDSPIFYKNLLQELAQKECFSLPLYTTMKTGACHMPKFYSFVEVQGYKFHGKAGKFKKAAEASAAKVAYTYFDEIGERRRAEFLRPIVEMDVPNSPDNLELATVNVENMNDDEYVFAVNDQRKRRKMYKQKLHELCQKKKWELPKYSTIREGFDHTPTFKSSVSVNGISFDSLSPSTSSKKSQNCAAEIAILHFSSVPDQESDSSNYIQELHDQPDIQSNEVVTDEHASEFPLSIATDDFEEDSPIFYKNLLQELAQKECFSLPLYTTMKTGACHMPKFYSFVEVKGEKFYGKAGKSKKAAEASAAKVAYTYLEEIAARRRAEFLRPILEMDESSSDNLELATVNVENMGDDE